MAQSLGAIWASVACPGSLRHADRTANVPISGWPAYLLSHSCPYRPVALTSTIMKCFEQLVEFITSSLPDSLDPLQCAYIPNRSTDDAITIAFHTALFHLSQGNTYVRMLFIGCSSAFNTTVPSKLLIRLRDLRLNIALCDWISSGQFMFICHL